MILKKLFLFNLVILFLIISICFGINYFFVFLSQKNFSLSEVHAEEDEDPPIISEIKIVEATATSTVITWKTDEEADSLVNYALKKDYGMARDPLLKVDHKIVLDNLLSSQMYYFRIISSDLGGNQSISNDYDFTTVKDEEKVIEEDQEKKESEVIEEGEGQGEGEGAGAGEGTGVPGDENDLLENIDGQEIVNRTLGMLEKIFDEESLSLIDSKIQSMAEEIASPPTITGDFAKVETGVDYAIITWKTDKEANSMVALASEANYNPESLDPYTWKEGEPDEMVLEHSIEVTGLSPASDYHYQVSSRSKLGLESKSEDSVFKTKSILPEIYNINIAKVEEESVTITWTTNVPCSAIIEYTDLDTKQAKLEGNSTQVTVHSIKINNLKFDTYYSAVISVENEQEEKTVSDAITFTTTKDDFPPVISRVNTESTLYPGSENRIQTIINWETDEQSFCQFFYQQGLALDRTEASFFEKEGDAVLKHIQVATTFSPASVYKFWIACEDDAGNQSNSEDFTMLTPTQEENILDLIIGNFEGTFGWLKKMKL